MHLTLDAPRDPELAKRWLALLRNHREAPERTHSKAWNGESRLL